MVAALERAGDGVEGEDGCDAFLWAGVLAYRMGRYDVSSGYLEAMVRVARKLDDKGRISQALHWFAHTAHAGGQEVDVRGMYEEAVSLGRESGDPASLSSALIGMGEYLRANGDLEGSLDYYGESLGLSGKIGNSRMICTALLNQARALITLGRIESIRGMAMKSLDLFEDSGIKGLAVSWLDVLAGFATTRGDWIRAASFHGASDALCEEWHYQREPADVGFLEPLMQRVREALGAEEQNAARKAGAPSPTRP